MNRLVVDPEGGGLVFQNRMGFNFQQKFSREDLRGYAEKKRREEEVARMHRVYQHVKGIVDNYAQNVLRAAQEEKTTFFVELPANVNWTEPSVTTNDYVNGFREKFPECSVELVEEWVDMPTRQRGQPPTRILKSGIKIDWS